MSASEKRATPEKKRPVDRQADLRMMMDAAYDGYWEQELQGGEHFVSQRFLDILGVDAQTHKDNPAFWRGLVFDEDAVRAEMVAKEHFESGGKAPFAVELRYKLKDGSIVYAMTRGSVVEWGADGSPLRMMGTLQDMTQLKERQNEANQISQRFSYAATGANVGFWDWPLRDGETFWCSDPYFQLLGYEKGEMGPDATLFVESVHPADREMLNAQYAQLIKDKTPFQIEARLEHVSKGYRWHLISGQVMYSTADEPVRILGSNSDIHELKMTKSDLERYAAKLEQANKELDHFAYVASHDLKAPLRGLDNVARWIEEDIGEAITPDVKKKLDLMRGRVNRMEALLKDILAFSRAGKSVSQNEDVDLAFLIDEIEDWQSPLNGFEIIRSDTLPTIYAPRSALEHIFLNLVSNGIKHNENAAGFVKIGFKEESDDYKFSVSDDGPGIPKEYREHVFEIFKKLRPRDQVEGSGIGLAIVKKMVEALDGKIWIDPDDSTPGTTFHFTIKKIKRTAEKAKP